MRGRQVAAGLLVLGAAAALTSAAAWAAWPDIYPSRIAAMEALRHDFLSPELTRDPAAIAARYASACQRGFPGVCAPEEWTGNLAAAGAAFGKRCSGEPLACVVAGWAKTHVDGVVSAEAPDPAGGARDFKRACGEAYAPACTSLGELHLVGVGVPQDLARAEALLEEGCKARDWWGCYRVGELYASRDDMPRAAANLKRACDNNIVQACVGLAAALKAGAGIDRDFAQAARLYRSGCEAGMYGACTDLGDLYAAGRGVSPSGAVAMGLYRTACQAGDLRACFGEGVLFAEGEGVVANIATAVARFESTCEAGYAPGCARLGDLFFQGRGVDRDRRLGIRYLRRGCDAGDTYGCEQLGAALLQGSRDVPRDPDGALQVLDQACQASSGRACGLMAELLESGELTPTGDRPLAPGPLREQACTLGHGESCLWVADRTSADAPEAAERWLTLGCETDNGESCSRLGRLALARGDALEGARKLREACQLNALSACVDAGRMFEERAELIEALALYERACDQGEESGCLAAAPITFEARFTDILRSAFSSSVCQLWAIDPSRPADSRLLVEVDGPRFLVRAGTYAGSEATAWHLGESIEEGATWAGRSRWTVGGGDATENVWLQETPTEGAWPPPETASAASPWETRPDRYWEIAVQHYEAWSVRDGIDAFPGPDSYATDRDGTNSLAYDRDTGSVRRLTTGACRFEVPQQTLQTENCSELQALLAASILTTCP